MPKNFPKNQICLGDHILTKSLRLGVRHGEVARQLGVDRHVLWGWVSNRKEVHLKFIPRVLAWLGYDPFPEPESFGGRLRKCRMTAGLSQEALGKLLGIRAGTIGEFERGRIPNPDHRDRIDRFNRGDRGSCSRHAEIPSEIPFSENLQ